MPPRGLCEPCRLEVNWLHTLEVAAMVGVTERTVRKWIECGYLHLWETPNGRLLICEQSVIGHGPGKGRRPPPGSKKIDESRGPNAKL